jgi:hypothetical protein
MGEWGFIVAAYTLTWLTLTGYALFLRGVRRRAETLRDEALRHAGGNET